MRHYLAAVALLLAAGSGAAQDNKPQGGATETTPSRSEYFSWINNTNEGPTARQTDINLRFFDWLRRTYGMQLDLYAFDAGAIDGKNRYGSTKSEQFKSQFPEGFGPLARQAAEMGTRLGVWGGPDGFGDTPEEARERIDMMVGLVRDYNFGLFKMDAVCGQLRPEKYEAFDTMMTRVRRFSPDFVLLNHRLNLGPGTRHSTTFLLGGAETYIDVLMTNDMTAPHHRAKAISRQSPKDLTRLTEDHGVCLSSCLDYWDDDLVLQAFGRELILAPQIYGNPWLLRDDEFPTLAFLFNLHRDNRDILPSALPLPSEQYGPEALSRGDGSTRFLTLRNLTWEPVKYRIRLDRETGLEPGKAKVKARLYHPYIEDLGSHAYGSTIEVEVLPFRAALLKLTTTAERDRIALSGIRYQVVNDRVGESAEVRLLGEPGRTYQVRLEKGTKWHSAQIDGRQQKALARGGSVKLTFPGKKLSQPWHRRLAELAPTDVPADAANLYYATVFAADNNALEVRSLHRSGTTKIPEVAAARDAFFQQPIFTDREIWDRNLFDGNRETGFFVTQRWWDQRTGGESAFCLDLGQPTSLDSIIVCVPRATSYLGDAQPLDGTNVFVSADLKEWQTVECLIGPRMRVDLSGAGPVRYLRFAKCPLRIVEVEGYRGAQQVDRSRWRASNLFRSYNRGKCRATKAWKSEFTLDEAAPGSYLCVAINGSHAKEGAWAAVKVDGAYVGCPDRAPSFAANPWECPANTGNKNYTYYLPLSSDMVGRHFEVYALKLGDEGSSDLRPEVWITTQSPYEAKQLTMQK